MEKPQDLRIIKTHKALLEAFMELLEEKLFEDITVHELCERAMVRRATFYKHFADKYEFFTFFIREIQAKFKSETNPLRTAETPHEYLVAMTQKLIEFLAERQRMVNRLSKSKMMPSLINMLSEQMILDAKEKMAESVKSGHELPATPEFLASFYVGGILQVLFRRFTQKTQLTDSSIMTEIETILKPFS